MRFRMLGPLEVQTGQEWTSIRAAKWRAVLARLLLSAGQVVATDTLIDELWGDEPPATATNLVSLYMLRLRRFMGDSDGQVIRTRSPGYQLLIGPDDLDAQRFTVLFGQGRQALGHGDPEAAARRLAEALALWRGTALADVPPSPYVEAEAERLDELRLSATELQLEAEIACGRHREVIPELRRLLADQPLREEWWLLLMRALDGAGRRAQALAAYERARTTLADQLGVDPGRELQELFRQLLRGDEPDAPARPARNRSAPPPSRMPPAPAAPGRGRRATDAPSGDGDEAGAPAAPGRAAPDPEGSEVPPGSIALGRIKTDEPPRPAAAEPGPPAPATAESRPMQLPADIGDFTGRELHVEQLCRLLAAGHDDDNPGAVRVALVAGAGGLGKTTLAVHAAHRMRSQYPDGQLYVDLQGAGPRPASPADVLARLLRDLGVDGAKIPGSAEERAALYRTHLNGRRILVLLDNARDAAQVRPLFPGSASCAVIVTSRSRLSDLVGGGLVHLDVLDDTEALALFSRIVGADRAAAEPDATAELLITCAGLPLAIRICAARLAARSNWTIRSLANRLNDEHRRLDELKVGDLAVRASFEVSFASLPESVIPGGVALGHTFRTLGQWQAPSIGLSAAAALLGEPEAGVADALEFLVDTHLLESPAPDQYRFHDLLRVYAAERGMADEPKEALADATCRLAEWYLHTAGSADSVVTPWREHVSLGPVATGIAPLTFTSPEQALEWCEVERENLVPATRQAAAYGCHEVAWKLPVVLLGCFDLLSYRTEWLQTHLIALDSARQAGDRQGEAWVLNDLGMVDSQQGMTEAIGYFEQALAIRRDLGDVRGEAVTVNNLADTYIRLGRVADGLDQLESAPEVQRKAGYRYGEGVALNNLGEAYLALGRTAEAVECLQQARDVFVETSAPHGEDYALHNLARAFLDLGRPEDAVECFQQALAIRRAVGDRHSQALTHMFLGRAQRQVGDLRAARESWTSALAIFDEMGDEAQSAEVSAELNNLD
ncbi:MAG TPA: BTAD domain-containing putative transcriptional regulator [Streptosporangiaceae bacterium]|jgi:DNA-binding SARP family transcriptional activator|nr:BTAD domain-containing putative transcriptional regulator [Streptosporangiaceae bacterium]